MARTCDRAVLYKGLEANDLDPQHASWKRVLYKEKCPLCQNDLQVEINVSSAESCINSFSHRVSLSSMK